MVSEKLLICALLGDIEAIFFFRVKSRFRISEIATFQA